MTPFPSPNFGARRGGVTPSLIVIHYTAMASCAEARARLCDPAVEVSAHWLISETGTTEALVDERHRAWHAGAGGWAGLEDINSHSIGIELANDGQQPFSEPQMAAQTQASFVLKGVQFIGATGVPDSELQAAVADRIGTSVTFADLEQLAARDFTRIKKSLGCDDDRLRPAQQARVAGGGLQGRLGLEAPHARLVDAHQHRLEARAIEGEEDVARGQERDLVLRRAPAEQDDDSGLRRAHGPQLRRPG